MKVNTRSAALLAIFVEGLDAIVGADDKCLAVLNLDRASVLNAYNSQQKHKCDQCGHMEWKLMIGFMRTYGTKSNPFNKKDGMV